MEELLRTNDIVLISLIEAIFTDGGIGYFVADEFMSLAEGSSPFMQRRIMVASAQIRSARHLLEDAGLADELPHYDPSR